MISQFEMKNYSHSIVLLGFVAVFVAIVQNALAVDVRLPSLDRQVRQTQEEQSTEYWYKSQANAIHDSANIVQNIGRAKNVILFLGDGMSITTVTAARILYGQLANKSGEEGFLPFEHFKNVALVKTYNADRQVPDSAGTATAFLCGVKGNYETIGVNPRVRSGEKDCKLIDDNRVPSIMKWAQEARKSTGIVTTARVTHATPAGAYAHVSNRDWESDDQLPMKKLRQPNLCKDIASQLIYDQPGSDFKVIMGGGRRHFLTKNETDPRNSSLTGQRNDGVNLIEKWLELKREQGLPDGAFKFVNDSKSLREVDSKRVEYLLGLFNHAHMDYEQLRDTSDHGEPSLTEMTLKAIDVLSKDPNGFVLLVEGARIDHAHHDNWAGLALHETVQFANAIKSAREKLPSKDTLIVVTADHAHTLTINGYPKRGHNILGIAANDTDGIPFTTLMYGNGPGHMDHEDRRDMTENQTSAIKYRQHTAVPLEESNHGGEDVAVYADGPMAHLIRGVQDQTFVAHAMAAASCIGQYSNANLQHCTSGAVPRAIQLSLPMMILLAVIVLMKNRVE